MKRAIIVLAFLFCVFNFTGCAGISAKDRSMQGAQLLEPQSMFRFSDVPVPAGFKLLPQDSYSFESSGVRVGLLKYRGKAKVDKVVNFYREQMPMYNWNLLNVVEYGDRLMNFDRDAESCIISLLPKGKLVTIAVSLGPKSQIPKKPDKPIK